MKILKKIFTQDDHVYAHKSWVVRWESRHGKFAADTQPEIEIFPIHEDAIAFKKALEAAFKLIRHTSGTEVTIEENV